MTTETYPMLDDRDPVHPGEILSNELEERKMSQRALAEKTGRPQKTISEIVNGKKAVTADTALDLERVLGIPARFWLSLQGSYDLAVARRRRMSQGALVHPAR